MASDIPLPSWPGETADSLPAANYSRSLPGRKTASPGHFFCSLGRPPPFRRLGRHFRGGRFSAGQGPAARAHQSRPPAAKDTPLMAIDMLTGDPAEEALKKEFEFVVQNLVESVRQTASETVEQASAGMRQVA